MRLIAFSIVLLAGSLLATNRRDGSGEVLIFVGVFLGFVELSITGFWKEVPEALKLLVSKDVPQPAENGEDD